MVLTVVSCKTSSFYLEGNDLARSHGFLCAMPYLTFSKVKGTEVFYRLFNQEGNSRALMQGPGCLSTICCQPGVLPEKPLHGRVRTTSKGFFSCLYMKQFFSSRLKTKRQSDKSYGCPFSAYIPCFPVGLTSYEWESGRLCFTLVLCVAKPRAVMLQPSKTCKEWNKNPQRNISWICSSSKILSIGV